MPVQRYMELRHGRHGFLVSWPGRREPDRSWSIPAMTRHQRPKDGAGARQRCRAFINPRRNV